MRRTVFASVIEKQDSTTVKLEVRGGVKGTGRKLYSLKCWDNSLAIENSYERIKHWLKENGYQPIKSTGCYEIILYWEKVIE